MNNVISYKKMLHDIFISFSNFDKPIADAVCAGLESRGIRCWIAPRDIQPGREWPNEIVTAISRCNVFILVFSNYSNDSSQTKREVDCALNYERIVIPFRVENVRPKGSMEYYLGDLQWLDALTPPLEEHIGELYRYVRAILDAPEGSKEQGESQNASRKNVAFTQVKKAKFFSSFFSSAQSRIVGAIQGGIALRNRRTMLKLVKNIWIDGVLEQSLDKSKVMEIGFEPYHDAVEQPWKNVETRSESQKKVASQQTTLESTFEKAGNALLILGEPGSGKTTLMLNFARNRILESESDNTCVIPVVFNLSSWSEKYFDLSRWMIGELHAKYFIPKKIAAHWVREDHLMLLLDGLDEVAESVREDCVRAINRYRKEHGFTPIMVCCRKRDYETLTTRLKLGGAIMLKPLSRIQINQFLKAFGKNLASLKKLLDEDLAIQELASNPLFLRVLISAKDEIPSSSFQGIKTPEDRRRRVLDIYIDKMLSRKAIGKTYGKKQSLKWLAALAAGMQKHGQTIFMIEQLQPSWLVKGWNQWKYIFFSRFIENTAVSFVPLILLSALFGTTKGGVSFYSLKNKSLMVLLLILLGLSLSVLEGIRLILIRKPLGRPRSFVRGLATAGYVVVLGVGMLFISLSILDKFSTLSAFLLMVFPIYGFLFGLRAKRNGLRDEIRTYDGLKFLPKKFVIAMVIGVLLTGGHLITSYLLKGKLIKEYGVIPLIQVIRNKEGTPIVLKQHASVPIIQVSPDNKTIYLFFENRSLEIWDINGYLVDRIPKKIVYFTLSDDGARLATIDRLGVVDLWDPTGLHIASLPDSADWIFFSPASNRLFNCKYTWTKRGVSIRDRFVASMILERPIGIWDPDGNFIGQIEGSQDLWGWTKSNNDYRFITRENLLGWTRNGNDYLFITGENRLVNQIQIWDAEGKLLKTIEGITLTDAAFNEDSSLWASIMTDGSVQVWDGDGNLLSRLVWQKPLERILFSPDSQTILTAYQETIDPLKSSSSYSVQVWNLAGTNLATFSCESCNFDFFKFNPSSEFLIIPTYDPSNGSYLSIWNIRGERIRNVVDAITLLGFYKTDNGEERIVTQSDQAKTITVRDSNWNRLFDLQDDTPNKQSRISPNGKYLATTVTTVPDSWSTLGNKVIRLRYWNLENGEMMATQEGLVSNASVSSVKFLSDGSALFTSKPLNDFKELAVFWTVTAGIIGLFVSLRNYPVEVAIVPNQGIRRSLVNAIVVGIISQIIGFVILVSIVKIDYPSQGVDVLSIIQSNWSVFLVYSACFSIPMMLGYGGMDVINHFILRVILKSSHTGPGRYDQFLDAMEEVVIVKKVGGGYIFLHKILQDHFAAFEKSNDYV